MHYSHLINQLLPEILTPDDAPRIAVNIASCQSCYEMIGELLAISVSRIDDLLDGATMRPETRRLAAPCSR
jgi:hypothetical protein